MDFFCFRKKFVALFIVILFVGSIFSTALADAAGSLTINYIESKPAEGQLAHDVEVTFSMVDSTGNPIKDLKIENITLSEDGQGVTPTSLEVVTDQPIYLALLLDTSGSMTGTRNDAAVAAAKQFVSGLNKVDRISVTTFNSEINKLIDFSTDHAAAENLINTIEAVSKSGTCLFDAAYKAVQETAALPLGRRAVIILTDGKDESPTGGPCSKLTLDDVIDIAAKGNTRVPIFTIGLGDSVDESGLVRLSTLTGGSYIKSDVPDQLENSFTRLLDLLQSQYVMHYTSMAAPGTHALALKAEYLNTNFSDARDFVLPELPLSLTIISPTNGQEIADTIKIAAVLNGHGNPIEQVVFNVNDVVIGTDDTTPYELEWDPASAEAGEVTISVTAFDSEGTELAVNSVKVMVNSEASPAADNTETNDTLIDNLFSGKNLPISIGVLLGLTAIIIVTIVLISSKKKKETKNRDDQWDKLVGGEVDPKNKMDDMTFDGFVISENSLGVMMVMQSDDPAMLGQRFEINDETTRLGRAADNEIMFPKDGPVSRHHAIIENRHGQLVLSELVSPTGDGSTKAPTFGTYVNEIKVTQPVTLKSGDLIRLGKRVVLKFETNSQSEEEDDARTMDEFNVDDGDRTVDSL
jgi:VWFA-related protein